MLRWPTHPLPSPSRLITTVQIWQIHLKSGLHTCITCLPFTKNACLLLLIITPITFPPIVNIKIDTLNLHRFLFFYEKSWYSLSLFPALFRRRQLSNLRYAWRHTSGNYIFVLCIRLEADVCTNVRLILKTIFKMCTHRVIDSDKLSFLKNIVRDWPQPCTFYNFLQKLFFERFCRWGQ